MADMIRVGAWQGPICENDFEANLAKVKAVVAETRGMGLDFLCFPEAYLSGYSARAVRQSSVPLDDPRLVDFIAGTCDLETVLLVGMSERRDGRIFNTMLVVERGRLLGTYHKTMLTPEDARVYANDLDVPVFQARGVCFGVVICHDTSFVEPALLARWKGARLLFTPHYNTIPPEGFATATGSVTFWEHRKMVLNNQAALATLLKMVVVRSNIIAISPKQLGSGDAAIWDMNGEQVAVGVPFAEGLATADFPLEIFQHEHWIDRSEVPVELVEAIAAAAREYPR